MNFDSGFGAVFDPITNRLRGATLKVNGKRKGAGNGNDLRRKWRREEDEEEEEEEARKMAEEAGSGLNRVLHGLLDEYL